MKKVVFEVVVEAPSVELATANFLSWAGKTKRPYISYDDKAVRIEDGRDVEKLAQEFHDSAKTDEPEVEEKPLGFNPTNEEYDSVPDPELTPSPDAVATDDPHLGAQA